MLTEKSKEDTFTRAGFLLANNYVQPGDGADVLQCWSQTYGREKIYIVTFDTCECWIGLYRKRTICKHRLACFGSVAVLLVLELRDAVSECDLEVIGQSYAEALKTVDKSFVVRARLEYRKCLERLRKEQQDVAA